MIITAIQDACQILIEHVKKNPVKTCRIMTYGIWIPPFGHRMAFFKGYANTRDLFVNFQKRRVKTTIIIGVPESESSRAQRYESLQKKFNEFSFLICKDSHAKCVVFDDGFALLGSMNITDSKTNELGIFTKLSETDATKFDTFFKEMESCSTRCLEGYPNRR